MEKVELAPEIESRKSLTNWEKERLPKNIWITLLEAARLAPSSWNHQPHRYIVIDDELMLESIYLAFHRCNRWVKRASGLIVQVARPIDDDQVGGKDYYLYDCGLAMMSLVYQAEYMGLGTRQTIGFDETEVKRILEIPATYRIVVITAIGKISDEVLHDRAARFKRKITHQDKRYKLEHIVSWQTWGGRPE